MIDSSSWPVVRWTMPARIPDAEAERVVAECDALLRRGERFALVFDGAERPEQSPRFAGLYKAWSRERRRQLGRWVAGAARIEPDAARREAVLGRLMNAALAAFMPYPFRVAASEEAALAHRP
ncbi:hypothetical protein [Bosea minatitlanensis]|uniref:Uncharacterized protein n=1 Tax=Bosea minatitlanensis TaxID=128782 RepID=A0ABW0F8J5_9HYPH|nr:hypothetical protein [Bosea minatitlanensis]MCT4494890.1 hypothetical protein [Bosea minatitlanensis]